MVEKRKISYQQGLNYKEQYELDDFMETSAKTGYNAQLLFFKAVKLLYAEHCKLNNKKVRIFILFFLLFL